MVLTLTPRTMRGGLLCTLLLVVDMSTSSGEGGRWRRKAGEGGGGGRGREGGRRELGMGRGRQTIDKEWFESWLESCKSLIRTVV